jgi:hypothetical protein
MLVCAGEKNINWKLFEIQLMGKNITTHIFSKKDLIF